MSCPAGQYYSEASKRCLRLNLRPGSKGKSQLPCPDGKVWNPHPGSRRCILKTVFRKAYGESKAIVASAEQKRLRAMTRKIKTPVPKEHLIVKNPLSVAVTPVLKESIALQAGKPRDNAMMPPGLLRKDMVAWIQTHCKNQDDPVTMEPYMDGTLEEMRSLVRLGSGFCYNAESLDTHIRSSIERKVPIKDMMNPSYRLDEHDYGALEAVALRTNKRYKLPIEPSEKPANHYKLFIGKTVDPDFKLIFIFDERKIKKSGTGMVDYSAAIPSGGWIGYMPTVGTAELERLIREAFTRGRLFTQAMRPFKCCRFHIKKTKEYWTDDKERKIKALEDEIKDVL